MIWIFHQEIADAASADNYDELHTIIMKKESQKFLELYHELEQMPWSFMSFTPQQVSIIHTHTPHSLLTEVVKEAYKKEVGLIVICRGGFEKPLEILNTPDADIKALKKKWCLAYCDAHGYTIVENFYRYSNNCIAQSAWCSRVKLFPN